MISLVIVEDLPLYNWFERGMELLWKFGFVVLVSQSDGKGIFTSATRIRFSLAKSGSAGAAEPTGSPPFYVGKIWKSITETSLVSVNELRNLFKRLFMRLFNPGVSGLSVREAEGGEYKNSHYTSFGD